MADVSDPSLGGSKRLRTIKRLCTISLQCMFLLLPCLLTHVLFGLSDFGFNLGCFKGKFEPEKWRVCTEKEIQDYTGPYAMDAMSFYNETKGTKYELVEPGYFSHALLSRCLLTHIDFTAKKTDVADAPEEMFFAELTTINEVDTVEEIKNNGCYYCMEYLVQHPRDGGFSAGGVGLFTDEESYF
ncbi:hypothetical protein C5167_021940 [Papaver somniferum]|uniref:DUF3615 domain-containing protein n=1 Tax=Papaver somniferum TaxID=3469 RepID=A0A4Y7JHF3_PAPSO|nr:hypothetical protein C5167_021940 [Papaver somniferum]